MTSYAEKQNALLCHWKHTTPTLPDDARMPGVFRNGRPYDVCLPRAHADHNLLPDVREGALSLFRELGIPWHTGVGGGPSNHLRSSQVQCVNALFGMVTDPAGIGRAFGHVVDIAEVLPIEEGRFLTFEYVDQVDELGEGNGNPLTRGSNCTSVDAAFRYRTPAGRIELALVEWKYTESYRRKQLRGGPSDETRTQRYEKYVTDGAGPLDGAVLGFPLLLDEPFYQLMRQQVLAHLLETRRAEGADVVRVLHVLSPANADYQRSLVRPEHRAAGPTVDAVWTRLLRHPTRFLHVDPAVFLDEQVTSAAYVDRYGGPGSDAAMSRTPGLP